MTCESVPAEEPASQMEMLKDEEEQALLGNMQEQKKDTEEEQ